MTARIERTRRSSRHSGPLGAPFATALLAAGLAVELAAGLAPALAVGLAAALVTGCAADPEPTKLTLPEMDGYLTTDGPADVDWNGGRAAADAVDDSAVAPPADSAVAPDANDDIPPANTPPTFAKIAALEIHQGGSTVVDLRDSIDDAEDPDSALKLSWSAKHVALQDPGNHVLYVVGPTVWFGTEQIELKVTDLGGLSAVALLQVKVNELVVAGPQPPDVCGVIAFSIPLEAGDHEVLLSGTFNGWASTPDTADVLTDADGDGVWSVEKKLAAGVHQYKFIVDGDWKADKANPNQTPDGYGGINSVIEVAPCDP